MKYTFSVYLLSKKDYVFKILFKQGMKYIKKNLLQ